MSIYQFGNKYIHDTGTPATSEEIKAFLAKNALARKVSRQKRGKAILEEKAKQSKWHAQYDRLMFDFFWDNEEDYKDLIPKDEEQLIYMLSTTIFDGTNSHDRDHVMKSMVVKDIKKAFPEYWERAVEGYLNHEHDT